MAKRETQRPRKPSPSEQPRTEITAEDGVQPLYAINKITYGNAQTAPSKSIFTPVSEAERRELLGVDEEGNRVGPAAARELDDVETLLAGAAAEPAGESEDGDAIA